MDNNQKQNKDNLKQEDVLSSPDAKHEKLLKKLPTSNTRQTIFLVIVSLLVVLTGIVTGWQLSGGSVEAEQSSQTSKITPGGENVTEAGVEDASEFETVETGVLRAGGFEGEGTHHLEKEGVPEEKFPYLTSAVIDLESFVGEEVQIWGHTIAGQKAGWLVDVGKIKITQ